MEIKVIKPRSFFDEFDKKEMGESGALLSSFVRFRIANPNPYSWEVRCGIMRGLSDNPTYLGILGKMGTDLYTVTEGNYTYAVFEGYSPSIAFYQCINTVAPWFGITSEYSLQDLDNLNIENSLSISWL